MSIIKNNQEKLLPKFLTKTIIILCLCIQHPILFAQHISPTSHFESVWHEIFNVWDNGKPKNPYKITIEKAKIIISQSETNDTDTFNIVKTIALDETKESYIVQEREGSYGVFFLYEPYPDRLIWTNGFWVKASLEKVNAKIDSMQALYKDYLWAPPLSMHLRKEEAMVVISTYTPLTGLGWPKIKELFGQMADDWKKSKFYLSYAKNNPDKNQMLESYNAILKILYVEQYCITNHVQADIGELSYLINDILSDINYKDNKSFEEDPFLGKFYLFWYDKERKRVENNVQKSEKKEGEMP